MHSKVALPDTVARVNFILCELALPWRTIIVKNKILPILQTETNQQIWNEKFISLHLRLDYFFNQV